MKKELRAWVILVALQLLWIIPCAYDYTHQDPKEEVVIETTQEETEVHINEVEVETVAEPQEEEISKYEGIKFYDVPLSEEIQMHIFYECDGYNIAPSIILAMIERESSFIEDAKGDHGAALGLMQIQPKWHQETMDKLGCDDLLDPYQNITVGVAIVAQLKEQNPDLYWVLMAYNMGPRKATNRWEKWNISDYAVEVAERASEIAGEYESR